MDSAILARKISIAREILAVVSVVLVCVGAVAEPNDFPSALNGEWDLIPESSDEVPKSSDFFSSAPESVIARDRWKILTATKVRFDADEEAIGVHYDDAHYDDIILGRTDLAGWKIHVSVRSKRLVVHSSKAGVTGKEVIELKSDGDILEVRVTIGGLTQTLSATRRFRRTRD